MKEVDLGEENGSVLVAGINESFRRIGENFGKGFFEIASGRVGKIGAANTILENGVTDKEMRSRVKTDRTRGVARNGNDFKDDVVQLDFFGVRQG